MSEAQLSLKDTLPSGNTAFHPGPYVKSLDDGLETLTCAVEGIRCGACVRRLETALTKMPGVVAARANASTHRLRLVWKADETSPEPLLERVSSLGFNARPFDPAQFSKDKKNEQRQLIIALGVAAFGAMNLMGFSYSVWAGLISDMGEHTRTFLHWFAALVALPVAAFSGQPFFRSAWRALRQGEINMDGPISFAIIITLIASLIQTIRGAEHVYFDAAISLIFFLLIGRVLEAGIRQKAGSAVDNLLALSKGTARKMMPDGTTLEVKEDELRKDDHVLVAAGTRFPADGNIMLPLSGDLQFTAEIDESLITGENKPRQATVGSLVIAGSLNLGSPVLMQVTATDKDTRLAEIAELMERAEQHRGKRQIMADKIASWYAPAVFTLSIFGLFLWLVVFQAPWPQALMVAVAVLVVTCPCAVGLATPTVMVGAVSKLMEKGIIVKSADAVERLPEISHIILDKTGTVTMGQPKLLNTDRLPVDALERAAGMAANSQHPLSRAIVRAHKATPLPNVIEVPGMGLETKTDQGRLCLGSRNFCNIDELENKDADLQELWLVQPGKSPVRFTFKDTLRPDAKETIATLTQYSTSLTLLSGDREEATRQIADQLEIPHWQGNCQPESKVHFVENLRDQGLKTLMIGDGLNDAPALTSAHVSFAPASASDISRTSADMIFQGDKLAPVVESLEVASKATRLVKQNLAFSVLYNVVAVPIALAGLLTPFIAALLMSSSSLIVMLNALRIRRIR